MYRCLSIAAITVLAWGAAAWGPAASSEDLDGTEITETVSGLVVKAGAPGSLALSSQPGRPGRGATVYCSWHDFAVKFGQLLLKPLGDSVWPEVDSTYLLSCWTESPAEPIAGYPTVARYRERGAVAGPAVSSEDAARFAAARIDFEPPAIRFSPPGRQVVGVPSWLAVTSRLDYAGVSANAGPVWASARAYFRDVTWDLGNGARRVCSRDVSLLWDPANPKAKPGRCHYTYTTSRGSPFKVTATVRWDIWQRTNDKPDWHRWGTITRSSTGELPVTQLQSSIR